MIPVEELERCELYERLTPRHKLFVSAYLRNGYDLTEAALAASAHKTRNAARVSGYKMLAAPPVALLIDVHFGLREFDFGNSYEGFVRRFARDIVTGRMNKPLVEAYQLLARFKGWLPPAQPRSLPGETPKAPAADSEWDLTDFENPK